MKQLSIKTVVAIGIGAALFFLIGRFVSVPTGIPNTYLQLQFAVVALFATLYGPTAGFLIAFLGNTLIDFSYGGPWWSWILAAGVFGLILGFAGQKLRVEQGDFSVRDMALFNGFQVLGAVIAWGVVAPILDIVVYTEPASKVFTQGLVAGLLNVVTVGLAGTALLAVYAKTRVKSGSLTKD